MKDNDSYNEGFADGLQHMNKTHIALNEVLASFDKFLDKIANLKTIILYFYNHHKKHRAIDNSLLNSVKKKKENLDKILKMCYNELNKERKD
jgi:hypothetical protein